MQCDIYSRSQNNGAVFNFLKFFLICLWRNPHFLLLCLTAFEVKSLKSCPSLCNPMDCSLQTPQSMGFSSQDTGVGSLQTPQPMGFSSQDSGVGSLQTPQSMGFSSQDTGVGSPQTPQSMGFSSQDTGVGSLSFLQEIFPTWGLNWGLLRCTWTLYQLS